MLFFRYYMIYLRSSVHTFKVAFKMVIIIAVICCFELLSSFGMLWYSKLLKTSKVSW